MKDSLTKWSSFILPWAMSHGVRIIVIFFAAIILNKIIKKFIEKTVRLAIQPDINASTMGEKQREETLIHIFTAAASIAILTIAGLMIFAEIGLMIGPILAGAGILGLALGFGGQYLIRDVISGLFIILENQYRIGDVVDFGIASGLVEKVSLRMTTLRDLDGTVHHVPHGEIKKVSNLSKYYARVNLNIGIAYSTNIDHVIEVINKLGNDLAAESPWKESILKAPQFLRIDEFGSSSIIIKILGETLPLKQWEVTGELRKRIKSTFEAEGIEMPFPQLVIHQKTNIEKP
ncbi:MAG TPA: mechanosensitive ion channel family protein [Cytophagaceae bacterium]|jgi:small conductance mechanosensitive channel